MNQSSMTEPRNPVVAVPAAEPAVAVAHFAALASLETDCWDVHASLATGPDGASAPEGFVLVDVRSRAAYQRGHVAGAVSLPHAEISEQTLAAHDGGEAGRVLYVVYCNGPHCNGADKGALRLAQLGRPVKKMIGGIEGWNDEGFDLVPG